MAVQAVNASPMRIAAMRTAAERCLKNTAIAVEAKAAPSSAIAIAGYIGVCSCVYVEPAGYVNANRAFAPSAATNSDTRSRPPTTARSTPRYVRVGVVVWRSMG